MRLMIAVALTAGGLLSACATGTESRYAQEYRAVEQNCHDDGGVLVYIADTGHAAADYACRLQDPNVPG